MVFSIVGGQRPAVLPCTALSSSPLTLANQREAFSCSDVSTVFYYTTSCCSDLCGLTSPGEGNNGPEFPPFIHRMSGFGLLELQAFTDDFGTFSKLISRTKTLSEVRNLICSCYNTPQHFVKIRHHQVAAY